VKIQGINATAATRIDKEEHQPKRSKEVQQRPHGKRKMCVGKTQMQ
jgi:hypothetical protein